MLDFFFLNLYGWGQVWVVGVDVWDPSLVLDTRDRISIGENNALEKHPSTYTQNTHACTKHGIIHPITIRSPPDPLTRLQTEINKKTV